MGSKLIAVLIFASSALAQNEDAEATEYLRKYGYIDNNRATESFIDPEAYSNAISKFQDFAGLKKTGFLDKETKALMKTARCGVEDRVSNYVAQGSDWRKRASAYPLLTYKIKSYPSTIDLTKSDVDIEIRKAFDMWQDASALSFKEITSGTADIEIDFKSYDHGDGNPFDGQGGVLAHAYFPQFGGAAHFDDSEPWSVTEYVGNQLLNTLTHEFGHSLGLRHSKEKNSIMAPFYKGWDPKLKLEKDDIKGIQALYGPPSVRGGTPIRTTSARPSTTASPGNPDKLCGAEIDAMVQTA